MAHLACFSPSTPDFVSPLPFFDTLRVRHPEHGADAIVAKGLEHRMNLRKLDDRDVGIALDEVTRENGCMRVLPGSHRQGTFEHVVSDREDLALNNVIDDPRLDLDRARDIESDPRVLSVSVVQGYPYADVANMGMSFLVTTNGEPDLARAHARELAKLAWSMREAMRARLPSMDAALRDAAAKPLALPYSFSSSSSIFDRT